jgi:hypothetical protein
MNDEGTSSLVVSPLLGKHKNTYAVHGAAVGLLAGQAGLAAAAWEAFRHRCGCGHLHK